MVPKALRIRYSNGTLPHVTVVAPVIRSGGWGQPFEAVEQLPGGWLARAQLDVRDDGVRVERLTIERDPTQPVPQGDVTSSLLRSVHVAQLVAAAADQLAPINLHDALRMQAQTIGLTLDAPTNPAQRPGRRGHGDLHFAQWAARYVDAMGHSRHPIKWLADKYPGHSRTWIRDTIKQARHRGMLTRSPRVDYQGPREGTAGLTAA